MCTATTALAADTGGLMQDLAPTIYAHPNIDALLNGEVGGGAKASLPGTSGTPVTERPDPLLVVSVHRAP